MDDTRWNGIIDDAMALVPTNVPAESTSHFEAGVIDPRELVGID